MQGEKIIPAPTRTRGRLPAGQTPVGKREIVDELAKRLDAPKRDLEEAITVLGETIIKLAVENGGVRVPGLGAFAVVQTGARVGRNPRTGEEVPIAAGTRVTFRASRQFKRATAPRGGR